MGKLISKKPFEKMGQKMGIVGAAAGGVMLGSAMANQFIPQIMNQQTTSKGAGIITTAIGALGYIIFEQPYLQAMSLGIAGAGALRFTGESVQSSKQRFGLTGDDLLYGDDDLLYGDDDLLYGDDDLLYGDDDSLYGSDDDLLYGSDDKYPVIYKNEENDLASIFEKLN